MESQAIIAPALEAVLDDDRQDSASALVPQDAARAALADARSWLAAHPNALAGEICAKQAEVEAAYEAYVRTKVAARPLTEFCVKLRHDALVHGKASCD